jgi:ABC-2 type transport system permease protein
MQTNVSLQPRSERGWRRGLTNLWHTESRLWWGTWQWLIHLCAWVLILTGLYGVVLLALSHAPAEARTPEPGLSFFGFGLFLFTTFALIFAGAGAIILAQGKIIGERQRGTAAWVLSKPVSRSAFLLAKCACLPGMLLTMVVIPGLVASGETLLATGQVPSLTVALLLLGWQASSLVFFFCLTLLLGTLFKGRTLTAGISLLVLVLLNQFVMSTLKVGITLTRDIISGQFLFPLQVILALLGGAGICLFIAIKRFEREEF